MVFNFVVSITIFYSQKCLPTVCGNNQRSFHHIFTKLVIHPQMSRYNREKILGDRAACHHGPQTGALS